MSFFFFLKIKEFQDNRVLESIKKGVEGIEEMAKSIKINGQKWKVLFFITEYFEIPQKWCFEEKFLALKCLMKNILT